MESSLKDMNSLKNIMSELLRRGEFSSYKELLFSAMLIRDALKK